MATRIQFRRDPAATWTSANPVLLNGEPGFETDTGQFKTGDGVTAWNNLAYTGTGMTDLVEDTTPELGGELDAGEHSIGFSEKANTSTTGASTIDWKLSNKQTITLTEATTLTFTAPSNPCNLLLKIVQNATGGFTLTLPTIKWAGGTAPTLTTTANAVDILSLYYDGTSYYGMAGLNFS